MSVERENTAEVVSALREIEFVVVEEEVVEEEKETIHPAPIAPLVVAGTMIFSRSKPHSSAGRSARGKHRQIVKSGLRRTAEGW